MSSESTIPDMESMRAYDLADYDNFSLTSAGELQVSRYYPGPLYVAAGPDILEVSKLSVEPEGADRRNDTDSAHNLYVIKNLSAASPDAMTYIDDGYIDGDTIALMGLAYRVRERSSLVVGRADDATPELQLSDGVSRQHFNFRLGNMRGNLHFADLYSTNGTTVYLARTPVSYVGSPRRGFKLHDPARDPGPDNPIHSVEYYNQRWSR